MAKQTVRRRAKPLRWLLLALEMLVILFAVIFFALVIEYTETSVRIVPVRVAQLTGAVLIAWGISKARKFLATAYEYSFDASRFVVQDVRRPKQPQPVWSTTPDGVFRWGSVGSVGFAELLQNKEMPRHNLFVHRGANLVYIYHWSRTGDALTVIEPNDEIIACLTKYCGDKKEQP